MLVPIKNRRFTDRIIAQLKEYILSRQILPGERLPSEAEFAETFGVSRGTIREALHILEHDGIVRIRKGPGGGLFLSEGNLVQVIESMFFSMRWEQISFETLMEARKTLEDRIARLAAIRAEEEDIEEIGRILKVMESPDLSRDSFVQIRHGVSRGPCKGRQEQGASHVHGGCEGASQPNSQLRGAP